MDMYDVMKMIDKGHMISRKEISEAMQTTPQHAFIIFKNILKFKEYKTIQKQVLMHERTYLVEFLCKK